MRAIGSSLNRVSERPTGARWGASRPWSRQVRAGHCVVERDALVEGGERAELDVPAQGGLAGEQSGHRACRILVGVGEQPHRLELVGVQEVGFVDHVDDLSAAFGGFGGEQLGGLTKNTESNGGCSAGPDHGSTGSPR
jgi:hypothetical protein